MDEPNAWYLMNCVAGSEMALLAQAQHTIRDFPTEQVEKIVVPTGRHLRSHGKRNVVEVKVAYPGYVFCKIRLCEETYEALQTLPLCRSWMAGTVNQKGYKKLPAHPIALSDEEVEKFRGLEEETDEMYRKYGDDYTGKGDTGDDLLGQYASYKVEDMVKVLSGNFKGEDGMVKRLKDGQIMLRLYTYGQLMEQWFEPSELRKMTDMEAIRGLGGPTGAIGQDQFDISIGKKEAPREYDAQNKDQRKNLNSNVMGSVSGVGGNNGRARREDRTSRGERGGRTDMYGRDEKEAKQEERNWNEYREKQRDQQQTEKKKVGDIWGLKENNSWSNREKDNLESALDSDSGWDSLAEATSSSQADSPEDDFFNSLMSELSDNLDSPKGQKSSGDKVEEDDESDDFFSSLMSDLSESMEETPVSKVFTNSDTLVTSDNNDFFANLESDLGESLVSNPGSSTEELSNTPGANSDDDFFANLVTDLDESLEDNPTKFEQVSLPETSAPSQTQENLEDDFFADLEADLFKSLDTDQGPNLEEKSQFAEAASSQGNTDIEDDDFFASLEKDLNESLGNSPVSNSSPESTEFVNASSGSSETKDDVENNFFDSLETELSTISGETKETSDDDFFASLETELSDMMLPDADVSSSSSTSLASKSQTSDVEIATQPSGNSANANEDFSKMTVVVLKQELRDRGLKVSGKKSELIERLQQS